MSNLTNPFAPITYGKDYNFYKEALASGNYIDGYANCNVFINIVGPLQGLILSCDSGDVLEYSFNGTTIHGTLVGNTPREKMVFANRQVRKIWVQGTGTLTVEAWS